MSDPDEKPCANCGYPKSDHAVIDLAAATGNAQDLHGNVFVLLLLCPRNVYVPEK